MICQMWKKFQIKKMFDFWVQCYSDTLGETLYSHWGGVVTLQLGSVLSCKDSYSVVVSSMTASGHLRGRTLIIWGWGRSSNRKRNKCLEQATAR